MTDIVAVDAPEQAARGPYGPSSDEAIGRQSRRAERQRMYDGRRIYTRPVSAGTSAVCYWADFRTKRYRDIGGKRVPLRERDALVATTSLERALVLYDAMKERLDAKLQVRDPSALGKDPELAALARYHLLRKKAIGTATRSSLESDRGSLVWPIRLLDNPRVSHVDVPMLEGYVVARRRSVGADGEGPSDRTILRELNALSGLFRTAMALDLATANPVAKMPHKPRASRVEVAYLSREALARLLDAAVEEDAAVAAAKAEVKRYRESVARRDPRLGGSTAAHLDEPITRPSEEIFARARCFGYMELVTTLWAYTGMRHGELRGTYVEDFDLEQNLVEVRPRHDRALKRYWTARVLQIPPAAVLVVRRYLADTGLTSGPLVPDRAGRVRKSLAKMFRRVVLRAGLSPEDVTPHTLRHTFAALRFETVEPVLGGGMVRVTLDDVAAILGQRGTGVLKRVYHHVRGRLQLRTSVEVEDLRVHAAERLRSELPSAVPQRPRVLVVRVA